MIKKIDPKKEKEMFMFQVYKLKNFFVVRKIWMRI